MEKYNDSETPKFFQPSRRIVRISIAVFAVLFVVALPTVLYFWDPPSSFINLKRDSREQSYSGLCNNNTQGVDWAILAASPCSDHFNWSHTENLSVTRNISVLKCGFKETDKALKLIESTIKTSLDSNSGDGQKCQEYATPILCHYIYQDCDVQPLRPTAQDCTRVQNDFCKALWKSAADYINLLPQLGKCFAMPNCSRDFSNSSTSVLFAGVPTKTAISSSVEPTVTSKSTTTKSTSPRSTATATKSQVQFSTGFLQVVCSFLVLMSSF